MSGNIGSATEHESKEKGCHPGDDQSGYHPRGNVESVRASASHEDAPVEEDEAQFGESNGQNLHHLECILHLRSRRRPIRRGRRIAVTL